MKPSFRQSLLCLVLLGCSSEPEASSSSNVGAPTSGMTTSGLTSNTATSGGTTGGTTANTVSTSSAGSSTGSGAAQGQTTATSDTTAGGAVGTASGGGSNGTSNAGGATGNTSAGGTGTTSDSTSATGGVGGTSGNASVGGTGGSANTESKFLVFLLIGQSNMEGAPQPEPQDREEDPRIKVLAYDNCQNLGRTYNEWYTASPPLHSCNAGVGPGDYFAKTLIEALPEGYTIGLVPLGVNGAPIDVFRKNVPRPGWTLPPDNHWETGFEWIMSRAQLAQEQGAIRGILFHQGESDAGQAEWVDKVAGLVSDLRTDLGLGNVPFLAGEMYRDGMAANHNTLVNQLPEVIDNAYVISSEGLSGTDVYHFDLPSQRELGRRYAEKMIELLGPTLAP